MRKEQLDSRVDYVKQKQSVFHRHDINNYIVLQIIEKKEKEKS